MMPEDEVRALARRVAARVLAERGRASFPAGHGEVPDRERAAGVHVAMHPSGHPLRPAESAIASGGLENDPHGTHLVTAESLRDVPDGGRFALERGAIVTELAREEAWRRRIRLSSPGAHSASLSGEPRLRIAIGSDHGGFLLKQSVVEWVRDLGHVVLDLGTRDETPVDYPDFAAAVAVAVSERRADLGIAIDAAGIGSAIAANKVPGVRAAMGYDVASAKNAREHNHANVLALGGKTIAAKDAREIVVAFLATAEGADRHARRVQKISSIESSYSRARSPSSSEIP